MYRLLTYCTLAFCTLSGFAQERINYNAAEIPAALKNRANAVIRNMETTIDMRSPDNVIHTVKKAITVLNKNGDERGHLAIYYTKNINIKSVKGLILDEFGKTTGKFSLSNFTDESAVSNYSLFEDSRIKSYTPGSIAYPYTIIYEYELRYKQNLIIPDWYANPYPDLAVELNVYNFIAKPEDKIRIKAYNYKGNPEITESDKAITHTWKVSNVPAFKREPYAPDPDKYLTYVKIAPEQFTYYGYKGSYKNWDDLGKWVYNNLIKDRQTLPAEAIQEVNDLVKGITDDKEKLRKIYAHVQKKTRYISVQVGIGGFQPFPAAEVQKLSYGDCKALVNYTQSLLKVVGINSLYCVVNAGRMKKDMDPDFASMEQGNHIILCVPLKKDTTWLECTDQSIPFGYLGSFTDDRTVFACAETGGKLLRTPTLSTAANLQLRKAELTIEDDGSITGKLKTDFKGAQYNNYDDLIHEPYTEQLKLLKNKYDIDNIDFSDFKLIQQKGDDPCTSESLNLTIQKYAPKTNNYVYLIPNAFNRERVIPEVRNRTLAVYINSGYTDEDELTYNLPSGYTIEARPQDRVIKSPFGQYTITIKSEDRKLVYSRKLVLNSGTFTADKYAELSNFFNEINAADNSKVIFKIN